MPNNSSARREKEKKKQSKKKKTAPPPLHKEDTAGKDEASVDGVPHPLSLSGKDNCVVDTSSSSLPFQTAQAKQALVLQTQRRRMALSPCCLQEHSSQLHPYHFRRSQSRILFQKRTLGTCLSRRRKGDLCLRLPSWQI